MDQRERFEAWMRAREGHPYAGQFANLMWAAWQAAEAAALERHIEICKDVAGHRSTEEMKVGALLCVIELRKLAAPGERGGDKS
jgi:hypothetical protein